jgi:hypothetical protein
MKADGRFLGLQNLLNIAIEPTPERFEKGGTTGISLRSSHIKCTRLCDTEKNLLTLKFQHRVRLSHLQDLVQAPYHLLLHLRPINHANLIRLPTFKPTCPWPFPASGLFLVGLRI